MAFGLELTGSISKARRPFKSPALASSTTFASLLRNLLCVSALKSGGSGSLPSRAAVSIAARLPSGRVVAGSCFAVAFLAFLLAAGLVARLAVGFFLALVFIRSSVFDNVAVVTRPDRPSAVTP